MNNMYNNNNYNNNYNNGVNPNYNNNNMNGGYNPNMYQPQKPKNNTLVYILVAVVVGLVVGIVIYFALGSKYEDEYDDDYQYEEKEEEGKDETKDKEESNSSVVEFSKYENYNFEMTMKLGVSGSTVTTYSVGTADVKNRTDKMKTTATNGVNSVVSYSYTDYKTNTSYTSEDNINWKEEKITGTDTINLKPIIDKINSNSKDVKVLGEGHYNVVVDFDQAIGQYSGILADVYVSNGYITKLSYDLSSLMETEGYDQFYIEISLKDFNKAGSVTIPNNVLGHNGTTGGTSM